MADDLAACAGTFKYTLLQTKSVTLAEAPFFHPQKVYEGMNEQTKSKHDYRHKAFLYRRAASLAINVNAEVHRRMTAEKLRSEITFLRYQLLKACHSGHDFLLSEREDIAALKKDLTTTAIEWHAEVVEGRLPMMLALKAAVTTISERHFRGHVFLTQSPQLALDISIGSWRGFTKVFNSYVPDGFAVDPMTVESLETGADRLVAAWEEEAEREARRLIYHDDGWPEFQEMIRRIAED